MTDGLTARDETSSEQTELKICYVPLKGCDDRHIYENKRRQRFVAFERGLGCAISFLMMVVLSITMMSIGWMHGSAVNFFDTIVNNAVAFVTALFLFFTMFYLLIALGLTCELIAEARRNAGRP